MYHCILAAFCIIELSLLPFQKVDVIFAFFPVIRIQDLLRVTELSLRRTSADVSDSTGVVVCSTYIYASTILFVFKLLYFDF